jgi:hypothetical protein
MVLIWFGLIHTQSKCTNKKDKSEIQIWSFLTSTLDGHERFPSLLTSLPLGKEPKVHIQLVVGGHQSQSGHFEEEKNIFLL